ncbi:MAG: putative lipoprotein [Parcubacteria group bacterium Athens0714_26]|nr:MAG: putative lipoprotein [Parcubacteria group bacterium Athens0714_26]
MFIDSDNNSADFEIQNCPSPKAQLKICQSAQTNQAPSAFFVYTPQILNVGDLVTFNSASSTDSDGQIVSYQWDFGDGATSTVSIATTTHTYFQVGDYQVSLIVFDNQNVSSTATSTTISVSAVGINHIVISEIQAGSADNADNEFIELYNPTGQNIDITNWSLKRKISQTATSTKNLVLNFNAISTIPAKGFFLIAHNDYDGLMSPDLRYSNNSNPLAYDDGVIILQDSSNSIIDEVLYDEILAGKSLERKANATSTADSMINNNDRFLGNSYDTDNLEDFILRDISNPQNSSSLPEPRNVPNPPQNFNIQYSLSAMKLIFSWQPSQDYSGATSTLIYKIIDISNTSSTLAVINTASTTAGVFISEIGRDYKFSIQAFDKEGLGSDSTLTQIEVPAAQINNSPQVLISQLDKSIGLDCSINSYGNTCFAPISNYQDLGIGLSGIVRKITINMAINTDRISNFTPYLYDVDIDIPYYGESLQFSKETMAYIQRDYTFDFGRPIPLDSTHQYQIRFSYGSYSGDGFQIFGSANSNSYPNGEWQTDNAVKDAYFILEAAKSRVLPEAPREQAFVDNSVNFTGAYDNLNNSDKIRFVVTELNSNNTVIKDFDILQSLNSIAVPYSFNIPLINGDYQYYIFLYKSNTEEVSNYSDVFNFQVTDRPQNALAFQLYKGTAVNCPLNSYSSSCVYPIPYFQDLGKNLSGQVDSIIINARVDVEASGVSNFSATLYDLTADINYVTNNIIPEGFAQKDYVFKLNTPVILDSSHQYRIQILFGSWYGGGLVIFGSNNSNSYSVGSWGDNQSIDEKLKDIYFILTTQ